MKPTQPTRDELLAMAFVDDQLEPEARAAFELRLAKELPLAQEVAALRRLDLFARSAARPEPIDLAWRAIDSAPAQRAVIGLGWVLAFAGSLGLFAIVLFELLHAHLPLWQKTSLLAVFSGLTLVFLAILKRRIQSRPFDPYTSVER